MTFFPNIEQAKTLIQESDAIIIGAGAGLSTAAGLDYSGKRFEDNFSDFIEKYGLTDMYSSAFFPFPSLEERWAYFSRHISLNRYDSPVGKPYTDLLKLVKKKKYFVITTNGDAQFFRAGFDPLKIFATQGDYSKFQCQNACHDTLYDNKNMVKEMVNQQKDFKIPTELIPRCPVCGAYMKTHLRMDENFVENADWFKAQDRYLNFIQKVQSKKVVLLELGIGFNTPMIIRWPFEQMSIKNKNHTLIRVNKDNIKPHYNIPERDILLKMDIKEFIKEICE